MSTFIAPSKSKDSAGQAGAIPGLITCAALGLVYSFMQEPDCGYGGYLVCW